jgi:CheY-like chemotaxis protein
MTTDAPPLPSAARTKVAPRRVLVIDDHPDAAESLAVLLTAAGHYAIPAQSAPQAFDALFKFDPEVCLVDLRMPGMDGFEAVRRLRVVLGPHVRMLAITGERDAAADPRVAAFDRVFTKPPDVPALLRAVADAPAWLPRR